MLANTTWSEVVWSSLSDQDGLIFINDDACGGKVTRA